jgi:hypothetical protein
MYKKRIACSKLDFIASSANFPFLSSISDYDFSTKPNQAFAASKPIPLPAPVTIAI